MLDFLLLGASPDLRILTFLLLRDHPGELPTHSVGREAGKTHRSQEVFVPRGEAGKVSRILRQALTCASRRRKMSIRTM